MNIEELTRQILLMEQHLTLSKVENEAFSFRRDMLKEENGILCNLVPDLASELETATLEPSKTTAVSRAALVRAIHGVAELNRQMEEEAVQILEDLSTAMVTDQEQQAPEEGEGGAR